jgi:hypothetical protein
LVTDESYEYTFVSKEFDKSGMFHGCNRGYICGYQKQGIGTKSHGQQLMIPAELPAFQPVPRKTGRC